MKWFYIGPHYGHGSCRWDLCKGHHLERHPALIRAASVAEALEKLRASNATLYREYRDIDPSDLQEIDLGGSRDLILLEADDRGC